MDHKDHIYLLKKGIPRPGGVWADFGSGQGAFTLALAALIGPEGVIFSIDKNKRSLRQQEQALQKHFPEVAVHTLATDFTEELELPPLDGLVIANALHFLRRKDRVVQLLKSYLRPGGVLLLVEYNTNRGNPWVPHPFSYDSWVKIAGRNGFTQTKLMATVPSSFLGEIYCSASVSAAPNTGI